MGCLQTQETAARDQGERQTWYVDVFLLLSNSHMTIIVYQAEGVQ